MEWTGNENKNKEKHRRARSQGHRAEVEETGTRIKARRYQRETRIQIGEERIQPRKTRKANQKNSEQSKETVMAGSGSNRKQSSLLHHAAEMPHSTGAAVQSWITQATGSNTPDGEKDQRKSRGQRTGNKKKNRENTPEGEGSKGQRAKV
jgi:hypothetical protein